MSGRQLACVRGGAMDAARERACELLVLAMMTRRADATIYSFSHLISFGASCGGCDHAVAISRSTAREV